MTYRNFLKVCSVLPALVILPAVAEQLVVNSGEVKIIESGMTISGNSLEGAGGWALNNGGLKMENVVVENNTATISTMPKYMGGGAILTNGGGTMLYITGGQFNANSAAGDGGAIAVVGQDSSVAAGNGSADEIATVFIGNTTFTGNHSNADGGTIAAGANSKFVVDSATFTKNTADSSAGAIFSYSTATATQEASGVHSTGGILEITNTNFLENSAGSTGAVAVMAKNSSITNSKFIGNNATKEGGALMVGSLGQAYLDNVLFERNYVSNGFGGAIITRVANSERDNSVAQLDILNSEFKLNSATTNGGAIDNHLYNSKTQSGAVYVFNSDFEQNSAATGGAIFNHGIADINGKFGTMNIVETDFIGNTTTGAYANVNGTIIGAGGAIYNAGTMTITDSEFEKNSAKDSLGGAFFVANGSVTTIADSDFDSNTAAWGGAGYTSTGAKMLTITDSDFTNNSALGVGALGIFSNAKLTNVDFERNKATDAADDGAGALFLGAVSKTEIINSTFKFNESASVGGAIAMRAPNIADNSGAKLDIVGATFNGNVAATNGGAIYSTFYNNKDNLNVVVVNNTTFLNNMAQNGGAIYNEGILDMADNKAQMLLKDVVFNGNSASDMGGAIYNGAGAIVNLAGKNTFANNKHAVTRADGGKVLSSKMNDIYNAGTLNIVDGTTDIASGIAGDGVINIASGATLNMGSTTIAQDTMNLDGTLSIDILKNGRVNSVNRNNTTAVVADDVNGKLLLNTLNFGDNGVLNMNIGSAGVYEVFGNVMISDADLAKVKYGNTYNVSYEYKKNDDGTEVVQDGAKVGLLIVETKSIADIATDNDISVDSAAVVSYLANSDSANLVALSLRTQQELNAGNSEYVNREVGKLNPDTAPITQSVATVAQDQILSLVATRVAPAPVGRSGGDTSARSQYGMWAQGLFNKSKNGDNFHGYSRGVAVGFDTVIDKQYTLGLGAAFNSSDIHARGGRDTDVDSNSLFLYAQYKPTKWYINGVGTYTKSEYDDMISPYGITYHTKHNVYAFGASVMTGYNFTSGFTPEVGARYLNIHSDDYRDVLGRDVAGDTTNYMTGVAGLKYAFALDTKSSWNLRPQMHAAAVYDLVSDDAMATVTAPGTAPYIVSGNRLSRMGGEFGLGMNLTYRGLDILLKYDLALRDEYTSQTGSLKFRMEF